MEVCQKLVGFFTLNLWHVQATFAKGVSEHDSRATRMGDNGYVFTHQFLVIKYGRNGQ